MEGLAVGERKYFMSNSSKIFAGSKLRRLRLKLGLSQTAFAQSLGLSASYLNLMERDQRPLTAQVVLKLSAMDGVDITELAASEAANALLQPLREMVADPLLVGEVPPGNELGEALQSAPNFAAAALKLYGAYREIQKRLSDAARGVVPTSRDATQEDWLATRGSDDIEGLAEDIYEELSPKDDILSGLKARLRSLAGVDTRIMSTAILGADRSRYDRHSQRLMISEELSFEARIFEASHLLARLEGKSVTETATAKFAEKPEQMRLAKAALLNQLALAILTPRGRFTAAAEDLKMDIAALARRFSISQGRVMQRLASLRNDYAYLEIDVTGRVLNHQGKLPFHLAKDEPLCAQLPLFGRGHGIKIAGLKNETESTIAIAVAGNALFTTQKELAKTIYVQAATQRPFGSTCRLCEVKNCAKRSAASATRPAGLNDYIRGATEFEPI